MASNRKDTDQMDLLDWEPPRQVIPFPSCHRFGHARKVAAQLHAARTNREADHILSRAMDTHHRQMERAGVRPADIEKEMRAYKGAIYNECLTIKARWVPALPARDGGSPGGAA